MIRILADINREKWSTTYSSATRPIGPYPDLQSLGSPQLNVFFNALIMQPGIIRILGPERHAPDLILLQGDIRNSFDRYITSDGDCTKREI